jgi:hypothetical protein
MTDKQHKADVEQLIALPAFRRFLWRSIQMAGIFDPATNGPNDSYLVCEGRRRLGFDLLRDVENGMPVSHPQGLMTLIQVLREEAQETPQEKPSGRRDRYDSDGDDDGSGGDSR